MFIDLTKQGLSSTWRSVLKNTTSADRGNRARSKIHNDTKCRKVGKIVVTQKLSAPSNDTCTNVKSCCLLKTLTDLCAAMILTLTPSIGSMFYMYCWLYFGWFGFRCLSVNHCFFLSCRCGWKRSQYCCSLTALGFHVGYVLSLPAADHNHSIYDLSCGPIYKYSAGIKESSLFSNTQAHKITGKLRKRDIFVMLQTVHLGNRDLQR